MTVEIKTTNTILYCREWEKTVHFYKKLLDLKVIFSSEWFVEFQVTPESRISIADERHSSIKSSEGKGITLTLEVEDIESVWKNLDQIKLNPGKIKKHPWQARVFYMKDPEGHRIEVWQKCE